MSKQKSRSRRRSPLILAVTSATVGLMALAPSAFALAPVNTDEPSISGTPQQGQTLTADRGEWLEDPLTLPVTYTYQWLRCDTDTPPICDPIGGATGTTYLLAAQDVGATIQVRVTATDSNTPPESTEATSDATMPIAPAPTQPVITAVPTISGTPRVGEQLTRSNATASGNPTPAISYQWQRCTGVTCTNIGGETGGAYDVAEPDAGRTIRVVATAQNSEGSDTGISAAVGPVDDAPENLDPPVVAGSTVEGDTLIATRGGWDATPAPTYSYQWQRCTAAAVCSNIAGATTGAYRLAAADIGRTIRVQVTASNSAGSESAVSEQTATVTRRPPPPPPPPHPPQNLAPPTISGAAKLGATLSGSDGVWQGTQPISYARQWLRCSGAACVAIPGATGRTYFVAGADVGYSLRFRVAADNRDSPQPKTATSAPTAAVVQNIGPNAAFRVSPSRPVVGDTVDFTSISSDPDGPVPSHEWDLDGDGQYADNNARGQIAARKLTRTGTHTVRLRVTDADGASDVETARFRVGLPPAIARPSYRISGSFRRAYTTLERVVIRVRSGAMIKASCAGRQCPRKGKGKVSVRSKGKVIRFRRYERNFRPGSKLAFRVTYPERTGRYFSYTIRRGKRALQTFRCLAPGSAKPVACPEE